VHFSDSESFGGTERALLQLLAGMDRQRWRPVLMHVATPGVSQLVEEATALGVALHPIAPIRRAVEGWAKVPSLIRVLKSEGAAVFHAHQTWSLSCRYGIVAAALAGVPAIVASAQLFVEMPRLPGIDVQHAVLSRCVDRHVAVSRHVASRLRERFGVADSKVRVIPNAVVLGEPEPRSARLRAEVTGDERRPLVLTVARLDAQKGLPYLLDAAAAVPDAVFAIAGDGPERAMLEARARTLGLEDRVRFLGHRRDVPALLAASDVFVLPSLAEGLPLSVLEAMAVGIPVVATAIGGTDEVVHDGETGTLVAPGDADALADGIRKALTDRDRAHRLAAAGQAYVRRRHSAAAMVAEMSRLYAELLPE
jgi:starch synthase (maltosyl-transferring)